METVDNAIIHVDATAKLVATTIQLTLLDSISKERAEHINWSEVLVRINYRSPYLSLNFSHSLAKSFPHRITSHVL